MEVYTGMKRGCQPNKTQWLTSNIRCNSISLYEDIKQVIIWQVGTKFTREPKMWGRWKCKRAENEWSKLYDKSFNSLAVLAL